MTLAPAVSRVPDRWREVTVEFLPALGLTDPVVVQSGNADRKDLGTGGQSERPIATVTFTGARDEACHARAVPGVVGELVAGLDGGREILALQHLPPEIRILLVHTGVDHRDGDALARAELPDLLGAESIQVPLLGTEVLRVGGDGSDAHQQHPQGGRGGDSGTAPTNTAGRHLLPRADQSMTGGATRRPCCQVSSSSTR